MSNTSSNAADSMISDDFLNFVIGEDLEEEKWRNVRGQIDIINQCVSKGETPLTILKDYFGVKISEPPEDPLELWSIILHLVSEGSPRCRIESINTFSQALSLIKEKRNIVVLTGAGISVPCGVPDFRSRNGIYARLAVDYPDLDDPHSMFDISYFVKNPRPFFKFAKEIYPGNFEPSLGHKFIKILENNNKLLRNYSQNIDTIEMIAGISKIIQCHGSFSTATCMRCEHKVNCDVIKDKIMANTIPICTVCTKENERDLETILKNLYDKDGNSDTSLVSLKNLLPIIKPDIVFFGEGLPKDFHSTLAEDKEKVDLLIVIGSSLKVRPVAHIPNCLPSNVPQILINKEPLSNHRFDVELYGDCDEICKEICRQLGWLNQLGISDDVTLRTGEKNIKDMKAEIDELTSDNRMKDNGEHKITDNVDEKGIYDGPKQINDMDINNDKQTDIETNNDKNRQENGDFNQNNETDDTIKQLNDTDTKSENCDNEQIEYNGDSKEIGNENVNQSNKIEYFETSLKYLLVSDLISEQTRVVHVEPNRYVFKGSELHVNIDNFEEAKVVDINDPEENSSYSSCTDDSDEDDDEYDNSEQETPRDDAYSSSLSKCVDTEEVDEDIGELKRSHGESIEDESSRSTAKKFKNETNGSSLFDQKQLKE